MLLEHEAGQVDMGKPFLMKVKDLPVKQAIDTLPAGDKQEIDRIDPHKQAIDKLPAGVEKTEHAGDLQGAGKRQRAHGRDISCLYISANAGRYRNR